MRIWTWLIAVAAFAMSAQARVSVSPALVFTSGGQTVYLSGVGCWGPCEVPRVFFDGVESPKVTVIGSNKISAVTPPHPAEGIVKVEVVTPWETLVAQNAFAYQHDRVQVLVPLSVDGLAGGTTWSSELWVHNDSDVAVSLQAPFCSGMAGVFDCGRDPLLVAAKSSRRLPSLADGRYSVGGYLYVPRDAEPHLSFQLRVASSSHAGSGTAVPIVRDPQRRQKLTILDVPAGGDSRKLLRLYVAGSASLHAHVYDMETGEQLASQELGLTLPTDGIWPPQSALTLSTAAIFEVPEVRSAERLRVEVISEWPHTLLWGVVSVTGNASQHVTLLVPQ